MEKKIFITGGAGFIGQHFLDTLLKEKNTHISVLMRSNKKGKKLKDKGVDIVYGDLLSPETYKNNVKNSDEIYHFAALFKLEAPKEELYRANVFGTKNLLDVCLDANVKKFIYCSTVGVYGVTGKTPASEDHPYPENFLNHYEWSKAESEKIVFKYFEDNGLPIIVTRPSRVYGSGNIYGVYTVLKLIDEGKIFIIPGDGKTYVPLVHVKDVANATIHLSKKGKIGEAYNITDDDILNMDEFMQITFKAFGKKPPWLHVPAPLLRPFIGLFGISPQLFEYLIHDNVYNNKKLKSTGYIFKYPSFRDGVHEVVENYKKGHKQNK